MSKITNVGLHLTESANAVTDTAGEGQIWVKSDAPSSLYYTDDAGTDFRMGGITLGTNTATTSGTAINYQNIPVGVSRIIISLNGVSGSGTSNLLVQSGDSGNSLETSGYVSQAWSTANTAVTSTAGFLFTKSFGASDADDGNMILQRVDSGGLTWIQSSIASFSTSEMSTGTGHKSLSAVLDCVTLTHVNGSDTFDAGSMNISYS